MEIKERELVKVESFSTLSRAEKGFLVITAYPFDGDKYEISIGSRRDLKHLITHAVEALEQSTESSAISGYKFEKEVLPEIENKYFSDDVREPQN